STEDTDSRNHLPKYPYHWLPRDCVPTGDGRWRRRSPQRPRTTHPNPAKQLPRRPQQQASIHRDGDSLRPGRTSLRTWHVRRWSPWLSPIHAVLRQLDHWVITMRHPFGFQVAGRDEQPFVAVDAKFHL